MAHIRRTPWYWFETASAPVLSVSAATPGLHDVFERALTGLVSRTEGGAAAPGSFVPCLDITSDANAYTVSIELPGVSPQAMNLEVKDGTLIIEGEKKSERSEDVAEADSYRVERSYGAFRRTITLPDDACAEQIHANCKDGVLSIQIPRKAHTEPESRKIEIAC